MEVNSNGKITDGVNHCYAFGKVNDKNLLIDNDFPCPTLSNQYANISHERFLPFVGGGTANGTVRRLNFEWLAGVPRTITTTTTSTTTTSLAETTTKTTTLAETTTATTSTATNTTKTYSTTITITETTTTTTLTEATTKTTTLAETTTKTTNTKTTSNTTTSTTTNSIMITATTTTTGRIPEMVITIPDEKDKIKKHNGKFLRYFNYF